MVWAKLHHQGWKTEESRISRIAAAFGDVKLGAITPADVERFLDQLLEKRSRSTRVATARFSAPCSVEPSGTSYCRQTQ